MTDMATLLLVDLAKELRKKNPQTNPVTWDISTHLSLGIDLEEGKVFYVTKPGGKQLEDLVTLDDILITTAAISFALENPSDKFTTQIDLYYQQGVRYYANLAVMAEKKHKDGRFVLVDCYIAFKNRTGHTVYRASQEGLGVWYQTAGPNFDVKRVKTIQQVNPRRDRQVFGLLREHVTSM